MNILYITPTDPRETNYGGPQRTHAIWKGLCAIPGSKVSVFVPVPHKEMERREPDVGIYHLCLERRNHPGWLLQRALNRFVPHCDYSFAYNWKDLKARFPEIDAVVVRYVARAAAFKAWRLAPLYLDADDIHTAEFDLETKVVGNSWLRRIKRAVIAHVQFGVYRRSARIFIPAAEHLPLLSGYPAVCLPNIPHPPLPNVIETTGKKDRLFFVGLMLHTPNHLAIDDFLCRFWMALKAEFPNLELHIVGGSLPLAYRSKWEKIPDVTLCGHVEDLRKEYASSIAFIAPMIIGSGSCIKVLESLRMGRPVIATPQGLRGIRQEDRTRQNGIFEYADVSSLVESVRALRNQSESERRQMAQCAARFVDDHFSQRVVSHLLNSNVGECSNEDEHQD